jgi:hypothetical protein
LDIDIYPQGLGRHEHGPVAERMILHTAAATAQQIEHQDDRAHHEQYVNEVPPDTAEKSKEPQHEQNYNDCPNHKNLLSLLHFGQ